MTRSTSLRHFSLERFLRLSGIRETIMHLEKRLSELRMEIHSKAKHLVSVYVKYYGVVPALVEKIVEYTGLAIKYSPDQPRDWHGRWVAMDVDKAVQSLDQNAQNHSTGYCARYVRQAIQAGGVTVIPPSPPDGMKYPPARIYGPALEDAGFAPVTTSDQPATYPPSGYTPQGGDVAVIQPTSRNPDGHMAMYNGQTWVSDFVRNGFWPGRAYRTERPSFIIYRH